jgi:hypothetical protein
MKPTPFRFVVAVVVIFAGWRNCLGGAPAFSTQAVTFLVAGTPSMAGEPQKQKSSGYSSPEEAWDAFRFAHHNGRWREAYRSLTADYQERYTQGLLFTIAYLQGTTAEGTAKKLKAILRNHGLTLEELEGRTDDLAAGLAVYSRLKDKEGLYCEAMNALGPLIPRPTKGGKPVVELGRLTKIKVTGDKAEGQFLRQLGDQSGFFKGSVRQTELEDVGGFRRINGRWFVGGIRGRRD